MTRWRIALLITALTSVAAPASAARIGLSGGISDPQALTDPAWQLLAGATCASDLPDLGPEYRCALYDGSMFAAIESIDFRMKDGSGNLIPFPDSIDVDPLSGLQTLTESTLFADGFTFRLSTDAIFSCLTCVFFSSFHDTGFFDPGWVSIVAVNDIRNVPEPSALLLLGPGVAYVLRRKRRVRLSAGRRRPPEGGRDRVVAWTFRSARRA